MLATHSPGQGHRHSSPLVITGDGLRPETPGGTLPSNGGLLITSMDQREQRVLTRQAKVPSASYSVLRIDFEGLEESLDLAFIWINNDRQRSRHRLPLINRGEQTVYADLSAVRGWSRRDTLLLGLQISGAQKGESLVIKSLSFEGPSLGANSRILLDNWRDFRPWSLRSINALNSGLAPFGFPLDYLASTFATLALLFTALLASIFKGCRPQRSKALGLCALLLATIAVVPWLDQLHKQGSLTLERYHNANGRPTVINSTDAQLQAIARDIKAFTGTENPRLFLIHKSVDHNFMRLRLQHHLWPVNVYNYGRKPPEPSLLQGNDYILLLDAPQPQSVRNSNDWRQWPAPPMETLIDDPALKLLRVLPSPSSDIGTAN